MQNLYKTMITAYLPNPLAESRVRKPWLYPVQKLNSLVISAVTAFADLRFDVIAERRHWSRVLKPFIFFNLWRNGFRNLFVHINIEQRHFGVENTTCRSLIWWLTTVFWVTANIRSNRVNTCSYSKEKWLLSI